MSLALASTSCTIPLDIQRVAEPSAETRGIRFLVRRPAYRAALLLDERGATCRFRLILEQTLEGPPILYEARGKTHLLSSTDTTLRLDGAGGLSALSAGEIDQTQEIVAAVASIAASFRPIAGVRADRRAQGELCPGLPPEGRTALEEYIREHRALAAGLDTLRAAIRDKTSRVAPATTSAQVRSIEALRELAAALETELSAHRFRLQPGHFDVRLALPDGSAASVSGGRATHEGPEPWFVVVLEPAEES